MSAIKRDLSVRDPVLTQALCDPGYHLRCDELVRATVDEGHPRRTQPTHDRVEREVEIGRKLAAPQRETIDLGLPRAAQRLTVAAPWEYPNACTVTRARSSDSNTSAYTASRYAT